MPRVTTFDKRSKRSPDKARNKNVDIVMGVLLLLMMIVTTVLGGIRAVSLGSDQPRRPNLEIKR